MTHTATVLYAEDSPVNVLVMQGLFQRLAGVRLAVARSGAEAWAVASTIEPALLLLDLHLPDCRGDDLLRRLRVLPACQGARAVAISAQVGFDARVLGFDEHWPEPLNLHHVQRRLRVLIDAHEARASLPLVVPPVRVGGPSWGAIAVR